MENHEFKARIENGQLVIQPIVQKENGNVTLIMPSLELIQKFKMAHAEQLRKDCTVEAPALELVTKYQTGGN